MEFFGENCAWARATCTSKPSSGIKPRLALDVLGASISYGDGGAVYQCTISPFSEGALEELESSSELRSVSRARLLRSTNAPAAFELREIGVGNQIEGVKNAATRHLSPFVFASLNAGTWTGGG